MISRLRQWYYSKARYEAVLAALEIQLEISIENTCHARKEFDDAEEANKKAREEEKYQEDVRQRSQVNHDHGMALWQHETHAENITLRAENIKFKQQIISLTASGITLKNELDEFEEGDLG